MDGECVTGAVPDRARFNNRVAQWVMAGFSLLLLVIGSSGLSAPESRGQGVFFAVLGAVSLVRAVRSSQVEVDAAGVTTRSMLRTRRYAFEDLATVEVRVGRTGLNGFDREYLVFHRTDGPAMAFKELNCRPSPDESTVVHRASRCIRNRLAGR